MKNRNLIIQIIAETLECKLESVTDESGILTHYNWDSLAHISIIVNLEEKFNIDIPDNMIEELTNVKKILIYLENILE